MTNDQLLDAQKVIIECLQSVRPELLAAFGNVEVTLKDDNSVVTALDKSIEQKLRQVLTTFDPGIGIVGEEFGKSGNTETFWLVDPIDGTESFIRGLPFPRNMVTLIDRGTPVMAIVYKFITDELYAAIDGQGAFCNGQPVSIGNRPANRAWIELSAPLDKPGNIDKVLALRSVINGYRMIGDFPSVVAGKIDGLVILGSGGGDWDYAPRALLIKEAGGRVANPGTQTYDYRNHDMVATNPIIFEQVMKAIGTI